MGGTGEAGAQGYQPVVKQGEGNPEAEKYGKMWELDSYRKISPGEGLAQIFIDQARPKPGARVIDFGCGTGRGGLMLAILGKMHVTFVDFVRNCLDPEIREALTTQADMLTFVKADLEQPLPVVAEYGFCVDVLEHVPPDKVDQVLDNILLAAQHVFFSIAMFEDVCGKAIGETLHLSVHPFEWWMEQFTKRECLVHWTAEQSGSALFYVTAWQSGKTIVEAGVVNTPIEEVITNVRQNIQGPWTQVRSHAVSPLEVAILGGGPSLSEFVDDIREKQRAGVKLITLNGTYGWAREHDLWPVTQVMVDARPFNARFVQPIDRRNLYLISSQCHPSVFEGLPDDRTWIWHTSQPELEAVLAQAYAKWNIIPGGSTVLFRAIPLLRTLGFAKFHLYGCDSCVAEKWVLRSRTTGVQYGDPAPTFDSQEAAQQFLAGQIAAGVAGDGLWAPVVTYAHHAYAQAENDGSRVVNVMVTGGRVFKAFPWMVSQAQEMCDLIRMLGDEIDLEIYGDGLLAHMLKTAAAIQEVEETA